MIRLLIYDLDGTLIDSGKDIANCVNRALKELGLSELPEQRINFFVGKGARNLLENVLPEVLNEKPSEQFVDQTLKLYRNYYRKHLLDETKLFPFVKEVLKHFESKKQAVITNKSEDFSRQILAGLGVESYFFRIVGGEQAFPKKPSPEAVFDIMKSAPALAHETVLIGDSDVDIQTGKNAGIKTIAVTYGFSNHEEIRRSKPDVILHDLRELMSHPLLK